MSFVPTTSVYAVSTSPQTVLFPVNFKAGLVPAKPSYTTLPMP